MSLDVYLYNNLCEKCGAGEEVFHGNITYNLGAMANSVGIYEHLLYPDKIGIKIANELVSPLTDAWKNLLAKPEYFKKLNSSNGWGSYDCFSRFLKEYLAACMKYPNAIIKVSR